MMLNRARAGFVLVLTTLILPLAVLGLGYWQQQRAPTYQTEIQAELNQAASVLADIEAAVQTAATGEIPGRVQFRKDGQLYSSEEAVGAAHDELDRLDRAAKVSRMRIHLPPAVIICSISIFALAVLMLLGSAALGWAGRRSRKALERGFGLVRHVLPVLLGFQVVLTAVGIVAAVAFEVAPLAEVDKPDANDIKMMLLAVVAIGFSLWTAGHAVFNLRTTLARFRPDPLEISGRSLSRAQAPGLWQWIDGLAQRLGALPLDQIVVGLTGGFFVTSGSKVLFPSCETSEGRTLYMPLPYLTLLRQDEAEAIIGHELGHFTGGDTEYTLRFVPIYAGVNRSLVAMMLAGRGRDGSDGLITRPAIKLGLFVMNRFVHAVRHWSRLREFAADAAGARITSADAAARALLRHGAVERRIGEMLGGAFREPQIAPADLVTATFEHARERGLDNPAEFQEEREPHPTDTHPPTQQRLAAFGVTPTPALLAEVMTPPEPDALTRISALFAAPDELYGALTADFVGDARAAHRAHRKSLEAAATAVSDDEVVVRDGAGLAGWFMMPASLLIGAMAVGAKLQEAQFPDDVNLIAGTSGVIALLIFLGGLRMLRRGEKTFAVLRPQAILLDGIDRPLSWEEIEKVGYHFVGVSSKMRSLRLSVYLKPDAVLPKRVRGARRAMINLKQRKVEIGSARLREMTAFQFADLVDQYRNAVIARAILEQQGAELSAAVGDVSED